MNLRNIMCKNGKLQKTLQYGDPISATPLQRHKTQKQAKPTNF